MYFFGHSEASFWYAQFLIFINCASWLRLFSGFSMIWIHFKGTMNVHWSEYKETIYFYPVTDSLLLFSVTIESTFFKTHNFVNSSSIWTNEIIAEWWDQIPWHSNWNNLLINTRSFIWHDVEQWVNLKWNAVTMQKGIKSPYMTFSQKNAFSTATILIYTSSYHSSICRETSED